MPDTTVEDALVQWANEGAKKTPLIRRGGANKRELKCMLDLDKKRASMQKSRWREA